MPDERNGTKWKCISVSEIFNTEIIALVLIVEIYGELQFVKNSLYAIVDAK